MEVKIPLNDPKLFGNDAAEDEEDEIFKSYALERQEIEEFAQLDRQLNFVRAYKGEGKSALLRITRSKLLSLGKDAGLIISTTASNLAPELSTTDFSVWIRSWKKSLLGRIASEVGTKIGFAWTDDQMNLVEEAEKNGFKQRNIISALLRRFKPEIDLEKIKLEVNQPGLDKQSDIEPIMKRWAQGRSPIWLFIDDVDQNFQNTSEHKNKIASFFIACRELTNSVPELRIRAAVRPNVWTTVKLEYEALSHVEQYMIDLSWTDRSVLQLLAKRIEGYLTRTSQINLLSTEFLQGPDGDYYFVELVFEGPMQWGWSRRPPHIILNTLSKHRPRWLVELCKVAGRQAQRANHNRITRDDILAELSAFGVRRIQDTVAEFRSQCPEIEEIIASFRRVREEMSTDELFSLIKNKVLNHLQPHIIGVMGTAHARDVAAFLFEIGFIYGRLDLDNGRYVHISFSERPHLLKSRTSIDDGLRWEIHPVFRQALEVRDIEGKELVLATNELDGEINIEPEQKRGSKTFKVKADTKTKS
jgi:hypothetical protein